MKTNHYNIFKEEERTNGCVAAKYTAIAESEEQVRELASEKQIDLTGYAIELERLNVRDQSGRSYKPVFRVEF